MTSLILSFPTLVILLLVMGGFIVISLAMLFVLQKYCRSFLFTDHTDFAEIFSDALGIVFGLILAFVTITVWQGYSNIGSAVTKEADALSPIYKLLDAYPPEMGQEGRVILRKYVKEVIDGDWAAMTKVQFNSASYHLLNEFHRLLITYDAPGNRQLVAQQEELRLLGEYRTLRLNRLANINSSLDTTMYLTMTLGAFFFLFYQCLYSMKSLRIHAVMISVLAGSLGLIFFLILVYSNPFFGPSAIQPDEFKKLLDMWNHSIKNTGQ